MSRNFSTDSVAERGNDKLSVHVPEGIHVSGELSECKDLLDHDFLREICHIAAIQSGANVMEMVFRKFPGGGATILLVLAESHLYIHTYPEVDGCFVDIFTCGKSCDPRVGFRYLRKSLKAKGKMRFRKRRLTYIEKR